MCFYHAFHMNLFSCHSARWKQEANETEGRTTKPFTTFACSFSPRSHFGGFFSSLSPWEPEMNEQKSTEISIPSGREQERRRKRKPRVRSRGEVEKEII
jgi:hypothetical protein